MSSNSTTDLSSSSLVRSISDTSMNDSPTMNDKNDENQIQQSNNNNNNNEQTHQPTSAVAELMEKQLLDNAQLNPAETRKVVQEWMEKNAAAVIDDYLQQVMKIETALQDSLTLLC